MKFCEIFVNLRKDNNLTQLDIANKLGFAKNTVCAWEKGRAQPNFETLIKLAKIFNVSIDYLLGLEDDFGVKQYDQTGATLTADEKELLNTYRALSDERQEMLIETANFYYEQCEKNGTLKTNKLYYKNSR